jgi:hypothetical protein
MGGTLLAQGWSLGTVYGLVACPTIMSGAAIVLLGALRRRAAASR